MYSRSLDIISSSSMHACMHLHKTTSPTHSLKFHKHKSASPTAQVRASTSPQPKEPNKKEKGGGANTAARCNTKGRGPVYTTYLLTDLQTRRAPEHDTCDMSLLADEPDETSAADTAKKKRRKKNGNERKGKCRDHGSPRNWKCTEHRVSCRFALRVCVCVCVCKGK